MLGGNLFGRVALHPAVSSVSDPWERGEVVNAAWRRFGVVNGVSLIAVVAGWVGARAGEARDGRLSSRERPLVYAKDALVATTAVTGVITAVEGVRFARMRPRGRVPLTDGDTAHDAATESESRAKRRLDRLGRLNLASQIGLVAVNAALAQLEFRRPAARRLFDLGAARRTLAS